MNFEVAFDPDISATPSHLVPQVLAWTLYNLFAIALRTLSREHDTGSVPCVPNSEILAHSMRVGRYIPGNTKVTTAKPPRISWERFYMSFPDPP